MTDNFILQRVTFSDDGPTYGVLLHHGIPLCVTLERPWLNNSHGVSCIQPGVYQCAPHNSPKHPNTWELQNVPGRSSILIHQGNTAKDTEGCIIVGRAFFGGGVTTSGPTLEELRKTLPPNFSIEIINP